MKLFIILLVFIFLNTLIMKGQCPPSTTCSATWTTVEHDLDDLLDENGFRASATFSYRINCDGDFEFIVEDIEIKENSYYLDEFSIHHYNYSSLTEKVVLDYMLSHNALGDAIYTIPAHPSSVKRI